MRQTIAKYSPVSLHLNGKLQLQIRAPDLHLIGEGLLDTPHLGRISQVHERLPLGALLKVLTAQALAPVTAEYLRLVALAVVLQAATPLAAAALRVLPLHLDAPARLPTAARTCRPSSRRPSGGLANLGVEGVGVAVEAEANGLLPGLLIREVIAAADAVAVVAELAIREAVAVELEALRARAVARLTAALLEEGRCRG